MKTDFREERESPEILDRLERMACPVEKGSQETLVFPVKMVTQDRWVQKE